MRAKKGEVLQWMAIIGFYVLLGTGPTFNRYLAYLRAPGPSGLPDPARVTLALKYQNGYATVFILYFAFVFIVWFSSWFANWRLANRRKRLTLYLYYHPNYFVKHEGLGLVHESPVPRTSIDVLRALASHGLQVAYGSIKERVEQEYYDKRVRLVDKPGKVKKTKSGDTITTWEIENLRRRDIVWSRFPIEVLSFKKLESFFSDDEIKFLKDDKYFKEDTHKTKDFKEFLEKNIAELERMSEKYFECFGKSRNMVDTQILAKRCQNYFNRQEISFLKDKGIRNLDNLLDADLDKLTLDWDEKFTPKSLKAKIKEAGKIATGMDASAGLNFKQFVVKVLEERIEMEKEFEVIFAESDYKDLLEVRQYIEGLKRPESACFLWETDTPIEVPAGKMEFDFFKRREFSRHADVKDMPERFEDVEKIKVYQALVFLPHKDAFVFQAGQLEDFNGHTVECQQLDFAAGMYEGMLSPETAIIDIRSCNYTITRQKKTRPNEEERDEEESEEVQRLIVERNALYELLKQSLLEQEDIKKTLDMERSRVQKKQQEMRKIWSKRWADMDVNKELQKVKVEPEPFNAFWGLVVGIVAVAFCLIGFFGAAVFFNVAEMFSGLEGITGGGGEEVELFIPLLLLLAGR